MKRLLDKIKAYIQEGQDCVLVSIIGSAGSTPRGAGAHMLVGKGGRIAGTIGGGIVEYRAQCLAVEMLADERYQHTQVFSLKENSAADVGMICGGDVTVYFRKMEASDKQIQRFAEQAEAVYRAGKESWLILNLANGEMMLCSDGAADWAAVPGQIRETLGSRPQMVKVGETCYYTEQIIRKEKVWIFGGGHVAQALVPVLAAVEFRCVVLEDREDFCDPALFPGAEQVLYLQAEEWKEALPVGEEDCICIMTRGHKNDLECQAFALTTPADYIGVIGSRRKIASTNASLRKRGFSEEQIGRITTPIGLDIGAETPAEIAVSIAAQLIAHRAGRRKCEMR